jgi:hypothetical protein
VPPRIRTDPVNRFWSKVAIHDAGECWEWQGPVSSGYGNFSVGGKRSPDYRQWLAHRYSWVLSNGPIPEGMNVCHKCDNRLCVNPSHLFLGTTADNVADKVGKDRQAQGESSGGSKLTAKQIAEIVDLYNAGALQREIGSLKGITQASVSSVLRRETWKCVGVERAELRKGGAKLTWADVYALRSAAAQGEANSTLAKRYGISERNVRRIVAGSTWQQSE